MKKSAKDVSAKEPRVVIEATFSINEGTLCKKKIRIDKENLNNNDVLERIEKEREKIVEEIEFQLAEGQYLQVIFIRADVKESFLNPDFKVGDTVLNRKYN